MLMWWPRLTRTPLRLSERKKFYLYKINYAVLKPNFKTWLMQRLDTMRSFRKPTPSSKPSLRSYKSQRQFHRS